MKKKSYLIKSNIVAFSLNYLKIPRYSRILLCLSLISLIFAGCATNPVTGRHELRLISEGNEISTGRKQYEPGKQMAGAEYICDPKLSAYVRQIGQNLGRVSDRKLPYEFTILNNSTPNAWALPGGKIAVNRGLLLELNNEAELAAVLSHEIVHAAARHGAKNMERGMLLQAAMLASSYAAKNYDYANLAIGGAQVAMGLITQKYSRDAELEADHYGMIYMVRAGYNPESAINLQETFLRLSRDRNTNWLTGLFASHPPSQERVEANKITASKLNTNGKTGHNIYQQKTAHLRKTAPAYNSYDKAVLLLQKKEYGKSLRLLDKAIAIEPKEALFHSAKGDIFFNKRQFNSALNAYNRAIYLNGNYFYFYEKRGLLHKQMGNQQIAIQDLKKSSTLLPTAISYKELGQFALNQGDKTNAKRYFLNASSSQSKAGKSALNSFIKLDISDNPQKYIQIRWKEKRKNDAVFTIYNLSPLPLYNISLEINFHTDKGEKYYLPIHLPDVIDPKGSVFFAIDDQTIGAKYQHTIKIDVISAQTVTKR